MAQPYLYKPFGLLRYTLALLVLVQHFADVIAPLAIKKAVIPWAPGNVAVLGFFMISGFIICEAYHYNYHSRPFAYLKNRLLRIVPGYWAALALSMGVHLALLEHYGHLVSPSQYPIGVHYFLGRNVVNNIFAFAPHVNLDVSDTNYAFFPYAWALQTEMMFYFTVFGVGCAVPFLKKFSQRPQEFWLTVAGFIGLALAVCSQLGVLPEKLGYGAYFAFGGALFYFLEGKRKALILLVPAFVEMLWHFHNCDVKDFQEIAANRPGQLILLSFFLVAFIVLAKTRLHDAKIDKWFGELSYSLYLNHFVVVIFILNTVSQFSVAYLVEGAAVSFGLAWLMCRLIEKPLVRLRRVIRRNDPTNVEETAVLRTETAG